MYRALASKGARWTCEYDPRPGSAAGAAAPSALPAHDLVVDNHAHTLVVSCPVPPDVGHAGTTADGRYRRRVLLRAWKTAKGLQGGAPPYFQYANVPICARRIGRAGATTPAEPVPGQARLLAAAEGKGATPAATGRGEPHFLAACTMITEHTVYVFAVAARANVDGTHCAAVTFVCIRRSCGAVVHTLRSKDWRACAHADAYATRGRAARRFNVADLTRVWVQHALGNGVEHILLYVDSEPADAGGADGWAAKARAAQGRHWDRERGWAPRTPRTSFEATVADMFAPQIRAGVVQLVMFNQRDRDPFETQQMMESHCIWRYKGRAHWVLRDDIDEFVQPLGALSTVREAVQAIGSDEIGAIQIRQVFWGPGVGEHTRLDSVAVWNMTWREGGPLKRGREKLIVNTRTSSYMSAHVITTGKRMKVASDTTQLRLNHFRRPMNFRTSGAQAQQTVWSKEGIGKNRVQDLSFAEHWQRVTKGQEIRRA